MGADFLPERLAAVCRLAGAIEGERCPPGGRSQPRRHQRLSGRRKWIGLAVLLLDVSKAAAPIGLAYYEFGWRGARLVPIALAPMLGHAYSPFLGLRGGKAIATALGVWIGLTLWRVPLVALPTLTIVYLWLRNSGWALLITLATIGIYLLLFDPDPILLTVLLLQSALLLWKHRQDLRQPPWHKPSGVAPA